MFVDDKKHGESLVELEPWRALLLRAADILDNGWCKYTYCHEENGKQRYCAIGAIWKADGWNGDMWHYHTPSPNAAVAFDKLCDHLNGKSGERLTYYSVPNWNDSRPNVMAITRELRQVANA